jgi:cysteine desulfurase
LGLRADAALQRAREQLAGWLGCSPLEVIWTSGATESNNAVLHSLSRTGAGEVWISELEHPSITAAARRWLPQRHQWIPSRPDGTVDLDWLTGRLTDHRPAAVAVMAANNETGVIQPWETARDLCREAGVPFFCDASQWVGKLPAKGLGDCTFVSGCAHKFGGVPGVGFLKAPPATAALLVGGPQEDGRRAGTENLPGILAFVAALAEREAELGRNPPKLQTAWRDQFLATLGTHLPTGELVGSTAGRLWNTAAILMPPVADCRRRWVVKLDKLGLCVSTGSACASGKEKPSPTLTSMGYPAGASDRLVRFSAGWETSEADWQAAAQIVLAAAAELLPR